MTAAVLVLTQGIVLAITEEGETLFKLGYVLAVLSMTFIAFVVLRHGVGATDAVRADSDAEETGRPRPTSQQTRAEATRWCGCGLLPRRIAQRRMPRLELRLRD
ncbi:MAG: hypothetical protein P8P40_15465 [Sulfitobacter sp.]|nr:hypothetical protein [Sulfitobacter sp.]